MSRKGEMTMPPLEELLKRLKLPTISTRYADLAREAERGRWTHERYLMALAEAEVAHRDDRGRQERLKHAGFPLLKTLGDFDFRAIPHLRQPQIMELATGEWIKGKETVALLGPPGTGKTHMAIALGIAACEAGYRVKFGTASALVNSLTEAQSELRLSRMMAQLGKYDLLVLDELGYLPFTTQGAQLLFQVLADRYERGAVLFTSNLPFTRWTEVFGDQALTAALLDRLAHRIHVIEMTGTSYRFKERMKRDKGADPIDE